MIKDQMKSLSQTKDDLEEKIKIRMADAEKVLCKGVRFIKNVVGNWYGIASAKFVGLFDNAAKTKVDGVAIDDLTMGHYAEYGISLEKRVYNFNISVNINRRDGAYTGWNGGVNLKYIF